MNELVKLNNLYAALNYQILNGEYDNAYELIKKITTILGNLMIETAHMADDMPRRTKPTVTVTERPTH